MSIQRFFGGGFLVLLLGAALSAPGAELLRLLWGWDLTSAYAVCIAVYVLGVALAGMRAVWKRGKEDR